MTMSGELQQAHRKQLESWIGTGPKDFQLLYSLSQDDGYDAEIFHQKCDNQGPTITVLYNTEDSIFGGCTSVDWVGQSGRYFRDDKAFLFQLQFSGNIQCKKFPVKKTDKAIYCEPSYGPTFGNERALECFVGKGGNKGGFYKLNGSISPFCSSYDFQGLNTSQVNNGHMNVRNLEVYKVVVKQESMKSGSLELPCQKSLPWKEESLKELKENLENHGLPKLPENRMFEPIEAGKSSFFNTVNSSFKGSITQRGYTGSAEHSLTTVAMSGDLKHIHGKQLEAWIGTGPKDIQLLCSLSQNNGYDEQIFHQRCDNQGPTVTVLYDSNNSIYGGYTSVSWDQSGKYVRDDKAFLFQLALNGIDQYQRFPVILPDNAIYCHSQYGPTFGVGHDLQLQGITKANSPFGQSYQLTVQMNPNQAYNCKGSQVFKTKQGYMNVTNLEVYKLIDKQGSCKVGVLESPWRKYLPWKQESLMRLMEWIESYEPPDTLKLPETRILMMGPIGAGKSSFFNTVNSIFKGRITQRSYTGSTEQSLTTVYRQYKFLSSTTKKNMRFQLCDTPGMEETDRLGLIEFNYLLEGNVPDWHKFDESSLLGPDTPGFIHIPRIQDKIHCVMFVLDSSTVDVIPKTVLDRIKDMQKRLIRKGVPQMVILTKLDKVSAVVEVDVSKIYLCEKVKDVVDKVSQTLGIPRSNIFPIKNYENETDLDQNINIMALQALKQVLGFANDYLENYLESENIAQMNNKKESTVVPK